MKKNFIFLVILLCICFSGCTNRAQELGTEIGTGIGEKVGVVKGYTEALSAEIPQGKEDGKEEGLSAKDTVIVVQEKMKEVAKLEVLVASVSLDNFHTLGEKYAALYLIKSDAVFSVDLSNLLVDKIDDKLYVTVPKIDIECHDDPRESMQIAEWQKGHFSGNAEDGFDAYLNSMQQISDNREAELAKNETLMTMAKASAKKQLERLLSSICGNAIQIEITFKESK